MITCAFAFSCPQGFPDSIPCTMYFVVMVVAVIGWLSLIFFPTRPWANFWFAGLAVPLLLSLIYIYLLLTFWFGTPTLNLFDFLRLDGVAHMFTNSGLLLVAWINVLAMDLVAGAWMTRKAAQTNMPYIYLLPCLIATFVFAGVGFTLYTVMVAFGGRWKNIAKVEAVPPTESVEVSIIPGHPSATMASTA